MKNKRATAEKFVTDNILGQAGKKKTKEIIKSISDKSGMDIEVLYDIFQQRIPLGDVTDRDLYWLVNEFNKEKTETFFDEKEIAQYSKAKRKVKEKPLAEISLKMLHASERKWIGVTTLDFLMSLRKHQIIRYNSETQRVMRKVKRGGVEGYEISLNHPTVESIKGLIRAGKYDPVPITLNISKDTEVEYEYNEITYDMTIRNLGILDIIDGFHNYTAYSELYDENPELQYPVILHITNWDVTDAQQFIFQNFLKAPMRKIDTQSLNTMSIANRVFERLNHEEFYYRDEVKRSGGMVNLPDCATILDRVYAPEKIKDETPNAIVSRIVKELKPVFNTYAESEVIKNRKDGKPLDTITEMILIWLAKEHPKEVEAVFDKMYKAFPEKKPNINYIGTRRMLTDLEKTYKEVR